LKKNSNSVLSEKEDSKKERFGGRRKALYDDGEEIVSDGLLYEGNLEHNSIGPDILWCSYSQ